MGDSIAQQALVQPVDLPTTVSQEKTRWQDVAQRQHEAVYSCIPTEYMVSPALLKSKHLIQLPESCGILNARELVITSLTATRLLETLHNGTYTAVEVTRAFCKRAAIAHQAVRAHIVVGAIELC